MTVISTEPITTEIITSDLARARRMAGLSQSDLAYLVDITQAYVSMLESGRREMPDDLAVKIEAALEGVRKSRLERRQQIGQMLDEMPLKPEHLAMLHGGG